MLKHLSKKEKRNLQRAKVGLLDYEKDEQRALKNKKGAKWQKNLSNKKSKSFI